VSWLPGCSLGGKQPSDGFPFDPDGIVMPSPAEQGRQVDLVLRCGSRQLAWCHYQVADAQLAGGFESKLSVFIGED